MGKKYWAAGFVDENEEFTWNCDEELFCEVIYSRKMDAENDANMTGALFDVWCGAIEIPLDVVKASGYFEDIEGRGIH